MAHAYYVFIFQERYTDVTVACDGKFYPAHKLVLSTCSDYFLKMFERTPCKHPIIVVKDVECRDIEALLSYMYAGVVSVAQNDLAQLIKAAELLQIKGLAVPDEPPSPTKKATHTRSSSDDRSSPHAKRQRRDQNRSPSQSETQTFHSTASSPHSSPFRRASEHSQEHTGTNRHHNKADQKEDQRVERRGERIGADQQPEQQVGQEMEQGMERLPVSKESPEAQVEVCIVFLFYERFCVIISVNAMNLNCVEFHQSLSLHLHTNITNGWPSSYGCCQCFTYTCKNFGGNLLSPLFLVP